MTARLAALGVAVALVAFGAAYVLAGSGSSAESSEAPVVKRLTFPAAAITSGASSAQPIPALAPPPAKPKPDNSTTTPGTGGGSGGGGSSGGGSGGGGSGGGIIQG